MYDSFGRVVDQIEATPQPFTFVGAEGVQAEPNRLYYMRARYYDPWTGRFISEDPKGFDGGDENLYVYVGNQPINRTDPSGQFVQFLLAAGILAAYVEYEAGPYAPEINEFLGMAEQWLMPGPYTGTSPAQGATWTLRQVYDYLQDNAKDSRDNGKK